MTRGTVAIAIGIFLLSELVLLFLVGAWLGPLPTFALLLGAGVVGGLLARRESTHVLRELAADASRGLPPTERLAEGLMILAGAVLLITPGLLSDVAGLLLLLAPTRRRLAPRVARWLATQSSFRVYGAGRPGPTAEPRPPRNPFDHPVA